MRSTQGPRPAARFFSRGSTQELRAAGRGKNRPVRCTYRAYDSPCIRARCASSLRALTLNSTTWMTASSSIGGVGNTIAVRDHHHDAERVDRMADPREEPVGDQRSIAVADVHAPVAAHPAPALDRQHQAPDHGNGGDPADPRVRACRARTPAARTDRCRASSRAMAARTSMRRAAPCSSHSARSVGRSGIDADIMVLLAAGAHDHRSDAQPVRGDRQRDDEKRVVALHCGPCGRAFMVSAARATSVR